ncbi:hypothetical protein HMPREF9087_0720 [Enterococcus casseliflavus ATCC 12755]|uniref:Uncharacterized protein n=2 Tax=Enterococcus casseliflavus TaxID=37734 RepID=F0EH37_ENTCA|nr:hypothetical protein HMPREF9087_0720 [Enterococcus casseliflavus ATCC 12755]
MENSIFYYFLEKAVENGLLDKMLFEKVRLSVERSYENLNIKERSDYNILIEKLFFNEEFLGFYYLVSIFKSEEKMYHIIEPLNTEVQSFVFKELENQELITTRNLDIFKTVIEKTSFDELCDELTLKDYEIVSRMQIDETPQTDEDYQMIKEEVHSDLSESIAQNLEKKLNLFLMN